jgi:hypothetical protein
VIAGERRFRLVVGVGLVVTLGVLLTRTWGLHYDEISYFHVAIHQPLGDAPASGKPYVFYLFNYGLYHLLRRPAGWLHPLILPVFYAAMTVCAAAALARRAASEPRRRTWAFVLLLLAPLTLLNATQVMMETALVPIVGVALAALLAMVAGDVAWPSRLALGAAALAGVLVKETVLPAWLLLGVAFAPTLGLRLWPLVVGAIGGLIANAVLLRAIAAPAPSEYSASMWSTLGDPAQWARLPSYLYLWGFFAGAAWIGALWSAWTSRDRTTWTLWAAATLSLPGVLAVQFLTNPVLPFARYTYPVLWAGMAAGLVAVARAQTRRTAVIVLLCQAPWITALWPTLFPTLRVWPAMIRIEAFENAGTILSGVPVHGWLASSPRALRGLCAYVPTQDAAGADHAARWFRDVAPLSGVYDETSRAAFDACSWPKAIVDRRYVTTACDAEPCPASARFSSCFRQSVVYFTNRPGEVRSRVCLP